ncbi:hypothetical protein GUA87_14435 [Sneathiella sp. P13V-1]|uniref:TraB/GumN family protein n=1 Tax=Sneathiella sp. P13V-1 TaxID=2697366 RepID=UPI00187B12A4|nr:TraB/GumN family protein [Sneathiella sp. P13V-1]MBE7638051.1 hypothetical protein [Sneathiella sp. P13V-1]
MRQKFGLWLPVFLITIFFMLSAQVALAKEPDACPDLAYGKGRLFEVRKDNLPASYIFGTMHTNDPRVLQMPGIIMQAFQVSRVISVEVSIRDKKMREAMSLMFLPHGDQLQNIIGKPKFDRLAVMARDYDIPKQNLDRMKPWAAATIFSQPPERVRANIVLDQEIEKMGFNRGKKIVPLETMLEQMGLFNSLSPEQQIEFLDSAINNYSGLQGEISRITDMYLKGDTGPLLCHIRTTMTEYSADLRSFTLDLLITARNHVMKDRMQPLFKEGAFIAIGAAHLPGQEGVLNLLHQEGYRVKRLF